MATHVERSIEVAVPVRTVYDQWTQFEEFPRFMSGVQEVRQIGDQMTHWVAEIAGVRREWDAAIVEQVPDQKVAWAATTGATNAGAVYFQAVGEDRTQVRLTLDYEPEGFVERIADFLDVVDRQAVADLDRFKEFIEQRGAASGGWRGRIEDGDVDGGGASTTAGAATGAAVGGAAGAAATTGGGRHEAVSGDVVAVGPTGGTHSTLDTEGSGGGGGGVPAAAYLEDGPGVGHSGDPVAVEPGRGGDLSGTGRSTLGPGNASERTDPGLMASAAALGGGTVGAGAAATGRRDTDPEYTTTGRDAGTSGPTADAATSSTGVAGFGTDTGLSSDDPSSGAFTGNPAPAGTSHRATTGDTATGSPTAGAATSSAGVAGFGTDTGLSSDDPSSGAFTGEPDARATDRSAAGGDTRSEGTGAARSREGDTDEFAVPAPSAQASGPGGEQVVQRDFANRDVVQTDVQQDFANREITPQDVAHKGVTTGMGGARTAGVSAREGMEGDTGFQGTGRTKPDADETAPDHGVVGGVEPE